MSDIQLKVQGLIELQDKLQQTATDLAGKPMVDGIKQATLLVTHDARLLAPVDTGRLKNSITPDLRVESNTVIGVVGTNVLYACVYGAHTKVTVETGQRTIGQIQIGERVLAQDGKFHRVIQKHTFPVTEKPDLIEIEIPWREGLTHTVILTIDHKVLVHRLGCNQWIEAGMLLPTDLLYSPKKIPHNKGTGRELICLHCGNVYQYQEVDGKTIGSGHRFCSRQCRIAHWQQKENNPHTGSKRSSETRALQSRIAIQRYTEHPETHPNVVMAKKGHITQAEQQMKSWLDQLGYEYQEQYPIGRHFVDFYVDSLDTIYECDGAYWHQDQQKDIARDQDILQCMPDVHINHIHFFDEKYSPRLHPNPLPNVYYIAVNPGMKSYTDLERVGMQPVLSLRKFTYVRPEGRSGAKVPQLFDLTIEGVHSFFANGILVSNSYVELGTKAHYPPLAALQVWAKRHGTTAYAVARGIAAHGTKARHYLQGAFDQNKDKIVDLIGNVVSSIVQK